MAEALCEFRFAPESPWDWTIPGIFYSKVNDTYPKRKEQRAVSIRIDADSGESARVEEEPEARKLVFLADDEKTLVQIAPNLLAVNRLAPYLGWDQFKPEVIRLLGIYSEVARPNSIARIGVRYINRIMVLDGEVRLEGLFNVYPQLPTNHQLREFLARNELDYPEDNAVLVLIMGTDTRGQEPAIMLDLDFITQGQRVPLNRAEGLIELAHQRVEEMFEACITDRLRQVFGGG